MSTTWIPPLREARDKEDRIPTKHLRLISDPASIAGPPMLRES